MVMGSSVARAQRVSVSTNLVDAAALGTLSAEASVAVDRHWSLGVGGRYNPWTFHSAEDGSTRQMRTRSISAGTRFWPWNVYSGWWTGLRAQWEEYSRGGWVSPQTEEGDAYGVGLSAGYSLMLHQRVNLDFGVGFWGGYSTYTVYECPTCGKVVSEGAKTFLMPSDLLLSLMFTF